MGKVFWNNKEIPIPEGGHIDKTDGRVFVYLDEGKAIRYSRKVTIGHATGKDTMHPNQKYQDMYPELWESYYGKRPDSYPYLNYGMYALTLGIGWHTSLYPILVNVYGPQHANFMMDFLMYSIQNHSNTSINFEPFMKNKVLFSKNMPNDDRLSQLFTEDMTKELNEQFLSAWVNQCVKDGTTEVWLTIDGSNNDSTTNTIIAEPGKAKSHKNVPIVSFMYALDAQTGKPIYYSIYNGSKIDSKSFQEVILYLNNHNVKVKGIILDRGFCCNDVLDTLKSLNYDYILMLKSNTHGHRCMLEKYANEIRWNVNYLAGLDGLFGIKGRYPIFENSTEDSNITLFFDAKNGSERSIHLLNKIFAAVKILKEKIKKNQEATIPSGMKNYIELIKENDQISVVVNYKILQDSIDLKGYCSIASSIELSTEETDKNYHLRDSSETQYSIIKTQLGSSVMRTHTTESIMNKGGAICFMATILRNQIQQACKKHNIPTNRFLLEIDRMTILRDSNNLYSVIHDESDKHKKILNEFNVTRENLDAIVSDINKRQITSIISQVRQKPLISIHARTPGRPKKKQENETKRSPGRPKGSLNKKTIAKQEEMKALGITEIKRTPGRPKGSLNKKTIAKLAAK